MKNYFGTGNGHEKGKMGTGWLTDISESVNKTYQKQMDMSLEIYNQLIGIPFSKERMSLNEDSFAMKIYKSSVNLFQKNIETYSDLMSKMTTLSSDSFFKEKDVKAFSDKMYENVIKIYETQIKQLKEFNNYYLDAIEKNTDGMSVNTSQIIDDFKNNIEGNLDSSVKTVKIILKPDNKRLLEDINKEMETVFKSNLIFWTQLIVSMGKISKEGKKNNAEKTARETKKEPAAASHKK